MPVTYKVTATVDLTADNWQLFTASMDCTEAAVALNKAATEALALPTAREAYKHFTKAQQKYADFGAWDSEPSWEFDAMVERVYGGDR